MADMANAGSVEQGRIINEEPTQKSEKDSEVFFDVKYFDACLTNGEWDEVEKYLSGFLKIDEDDVSLYIFFEIRKQKYLEALDRKDYANAVDILRKDLQFLSRCNQSLFTEITMLLTLENFRENIMLSTYGDAKSSRDELLDILKEKLKRYAFFCPKHEVGNSDNSEPTIPVNQRYGNNPMANPLVGQGGTSAPIYAPAPPMMAIQNRNLIASAPFSRPNPLTASNTSTPAPVPPMVQMQNFIPFAYASLSTPNPLTGSNNAIPAPAPTMVPMQNENPFASASFPLQHHLMRSYPTLPIQPAVAPPMLPVGGFMPDSLHVPHQAVSALPLDLNAPAVEVLEPQIKRQRLSGTVEKTNNSSINTSLDMYLDALPQTAIVNFYQGSQVQSLDFHPVQQTLLLVGAANGDISIWEMGETEWLVRQPFEIWDIGACSSSVQTSFSHDSTASVNRVLWSPDGAFFGVAYSKHLVHIYSYEDDVLKKYIEIDAHFGNVYDISFSHQSKPLCIITCGEDNTIRMWMAVTGGRFSQVYSFVGHEAPVYSVCPYEDGKQYLFSVDTNGKIIAWIYGTKLFTCDACPSWGRMACSADGTRLFLCGTDSNGDSYLVEWDHKEGGFVKHMYRGLRRRSTGIVQFDTANNRILAAGDEFQIKFWNMDSVKQLSHTFAAGGLPSCPCLRFNKGGTLLAVSTLEDGIKVLANASGLRLWHSMEKRPLVSRKIHIDVISSKSATATRDDEVVGGSSGYSSFEQSSPDNTSESSVEQPSY